MYLIIITALLVGGATILGTLIGFCFRNITSRFSNLTMSFCAGIMLSASILGLILPAMEHSGRWCIPVCTIGLFCGAVCVHSSSRLLPCLRKLMGISSHSSTGIIDDSVLLFTAAIAFHNLPEGLSAGIAFGTGCIHDAILIAGGIALQNIPEGMVTIVPLLLSGIPPRKAVVCGLLTGISEICGVLLGYLTVTASASILPFALIFAGGMMLFVIIDEMIPAARTAPQNDQTSFVFLAGFTMMMICDYLLQ